MVLVNGTGYWYWLLVLLESQCGLAEWTRLQPRCHCLWTCQSEHSVLLWHQGAGLKPGCCLSITGSINLGGGGGCRPVSEEVCSGGKKKVPSLNDDFDLFYTWIKVILISVLRPWVCVDRWRSEQKGTRSTSCFSSSVVVVVVVVSYVDSEPGQPEQSSWPLIRADQWWCPEFQTWRRWRRGSLFLFSRFYCKTICDRVFTEVWWKKTPK